MGYTHYWYVKRDADREKVAEAGRQMAEAVREATVELAGGLGTGEPELGEDGTVWFNGRGPEDNHETFAWPPDLDDAQGWRPAALGDSDSVFTFCKTARKPYDAVVVACLLRAKAVLGDAIRVATDAQSPEEFAGSEVSEGWRDVNAQLGHPTEDSGGETASSLYRRVYGEDPDLAEIFEKEESHEATTR